MASLLTATAYLPIPLGTQSYTLKDDSVYYSLEGALSFSMMDFDVFRGRTFRNELPAGVLGRAWAASYVKPTIPQSPGDTLFPEAYDDRVIQEDPRQEMITITYMVFWDGATGSGNVIAFCPENIFEQFSPEPPTRY